MARKPRKPKKPTIPAPSTLDPLAAWSMPQIQSWAQRQARATIDPILRDIDAQQANNTANITGFSEALARTLAPLGRQVQGAYQTAAGMGDAFGSGFEEGLRMLGGQATTEGGGQVAGSLAGLAGNLSTIAGRGIGQEGAAQTTLADTYALAPANTGQMYLREAQGRFDRQRGEVRSKVPETVQAIIQDLLDREIQKDAQRANRETLGLQKAQFEEDKRRFDVETDLKRQGLELDWAQLAAQRQEWDADRTERARKEYEKAVKDGKTDRAAAIAKREAALSDAQSDILKTVESLKNGESTVTYWAGSKWVDETDASGQPVYEVDENGDPVIGADGYPVKKRRREVISETKTFPNAPVTRDAMYKRLKSMYAPTLKSRYKFSDKTIELLIWDVLRQSGYENIYTSAPA